MTSEMFRTISMYEQVPAAIFEGEEAFDPSVPPTETWPSRRGGAGQTSRSPEPLVANDWTVLREIALETAIEPDALLIGTDVIVASGRASIGVWRKDGVPVAQVPRVPGTCFLDLAGQHLLTSAEGGGVMARSLPDTNRSAQILLAFPSGHKTKEIVQGPGALVILSVRESIFGPSPQAVVEAVRIKDYANRGPTGILYGIEPLAGIIRDLDSDVELAAGKNGPLCATPDGITWYDWQLRKSIDFQIDSNPIALSADSEGRAYLVHDRDGACTLSIVPRGGPVQAEVTLPWDASLPTPPVVSSSGYVFLTPPGQVLAVDPTGRILWHRERSSRCAGTVTSNGLLLLPDDGLCAVTIEGDRFPLWRLSEPAMTPPILAQGKLHVATASKLYVLQPA